MFASRQIKLVVLLVAVMALPAVCVAQDAANASDGKKLPELWADTLHYIKLARADLAKTYAEAILASGAQPREIYAVSVTTPTYRATLARGEKLPGMAETIQKLRKIIEQGYEAERADPEQIARSIEMLGQSLSAYELGVRRLNVSGEYALPQLIQKLTDPKASNLLKERIVTMLPKLGKEAVRPMAAALRTDDAKLQEWLAISLGRIGYPHCVPQLKELMERDGVLDSTKRAARGAIVSCAGAKALEKSVAELYYDLAERYYYQAESVRPDMRYDTANVWYWRANLGLTYKVAPSPIFCDVYAMRYSERALQHDPEFHPAVSLWIAANLRKEADLPADAADPTRGERPSAEYYALASPAQYLQHVLARAMKDHSEPVAVGAIKALARTAGSENLVEPVAGGMQPLVQALRYPNRRVQFGAGLALAGALPAKPIGRGQDELLVMDVLSKALRQTGQKRAVLIAGGEAANAMKDTLRGAGYDVIHEPELTRALAAAATSAGVDLVVLAGMTDATDEVARLRSEAPMAIVPIVLAVDTNKMNRLAKRDGRIAILPEGGNLAEAADNALTLGVGRPISPEEATDYAVRSAKAVEKLTLTANRVLNASLARPALIEALADPRAAVRVAAAEALAAMADSDAQRAIAGLATRNDVDEPVRIAAFQALSASLRAHGNLLTDSLAQAVMAVVEGQGSPELLNAAAQAAGAMGLPSDKIISLIAPKQ